MRIVCDLDSTLADDSHRLHHIKKDPKDWDSYFSECFEDSLIDSTFRVLKSLYCSKHLIEIWSAREAGENNEIRSITLKWLMKYGLHVRGESKHNLDFPNARRSHNITIERLLMRMRGDYTNDYELKRRWLNIARAANQTPNLVFEDRDRVVNMWRVEGIDCFQVAEGNF